MPRGHPFPPFVARAPWWGADLQTLRNVLRGPVLEVEPEARQERLILALEDGSGDRLAALLERPTEPGPSAEAPLVVLIHGLGGDETSPYIEASATHLLAHGVSVLRLNLRGAGPSRPLCSQQYHAGRTEDLRDALAALPAGSAPGGLVLVGFSLGGNMLLKFLAEYGADLKGLRGAVAISAPIDLEHSSRRILEPRNWFYHRYLLNGMKEEALAADSNTEEERRIIGTVRTILEFDEHLVAPRNGFAGAVDYYGRTHARQFLLEIGVETLVIHALDDPWIPAPMYTSFDWAQNPHLTPLLASSGGHVGFHAADSRVPWHDRCLVRFLERIAGVETHRRVPVPSATRA